MSNQMSNQVITPTVGRIVHFYGKDCEDPRAAIVTCVHSDTKVNLTVFGSTGVAYGMTNVPLIQPGQEKDESVVQFCEWMPYQVKKDTGSESGEKEAGTQTI